MTREKPRQNWEEELGEAYNQFFKDMDIDEKSGKFIRNKHSDKKFATYPYVGSKYGNNGNAKKILFIGQDIGIGRWTLGHIQYFSERRAGIEEKPLYCHNPHIAGTYMTALYFLKDKFDGSARWEKIVDTGFTCKRVLSDRKELLPSENPLSYCALTNYHKFMTKGVEKMRDRDKRNLEWLCRDKEEGLFRKEIEIFGPDIVIFQGKNEEFPRAAENLNSKGEVREIYVGYHPSYVPAQKPEELIKSIRAGKL